MASYPQGQVNVRQIEIGTRFYLFTAAEPSGDAPPRLIITSHGGYEPKPVRNHDAKGWLTVPAWTTLYFYADHGYTLEDPGLSNVLGHRPAQEQGPGTVVQNYVLSKFQEKGKGAGIETYDGIVKGIQSVHGQRDLQREILRENGLDLDAETNPAETERRLAAIEAAAPDGKKDLIQRVKGQRQIELYDVLTVRRRRLQADVTLRDVLRELESAGLHYAEVHCVFCRNPILSVFSRTKIPSMTALPEDRWARTGDFARRPR